MPFESQPSLHACEGIITYKWIAMLLLRYMYVYLHTLEITYITGFCFGFLQTVFGILINLGLPANVAYKPHNYYVR